jgi:hypothetical protein
MLGPVWSLARHLPTIGGGIPFDALSMGSAPGRDAACGALFVTEMLGEAQALAARIPALLPSDYPADAAKDTLVALHEAGATPVR